jgi:hypothetical protein
MNSAAPTEIAAARQRPDRRMIVALRRRCADWRRLGRCPAFPAHDQETLEVAEREADALMQAHP